MLLNGVGGGGCSGEEGSWSKLPGGKTQEVKGRLPETERNKRTLRHDLNKKKKLLFF